MAAACRDHGNLSNVNATLTKTACVMFCTYDALCALYDSYQALYQFNLLHVFCLKKRK